jgi:hypothetical protein
MVLKQLSIVGQEIRKMNKENFFSSVRTDLFGSLTQSQVDGINTILDCIKELPTNMQAYILATAYHETAKTMQPISEYGKGKNYPYGRWETNSKGQKYCYKSGLKARVYTEQEYPNLYYGRGYVQLTWFNNYELATKKLQDAGILTKEQSLLDNPELANDPKIAAYIMKHGMLGGWFTGRALHHYFSDTLSDYVNARRIINGTDQKDLIAGYAKKFEKALQS